jgi:hypothetical protein
MAQLNPDEHRNVYGGVGGYLRLVNDGFERNWAIAQYAYAHQNLPAVWRQHACKVV